jgi:hypothetical protein
MLLEIRRARSGVNVSACIAGLSIASFANAIASAALWRVDGVVKISRGRWPSRMITDPPCFRISANQLPGRCSKARMM